MSMSSAEQSRQSPQAAQPTQPEGTGTSGAPGAPGSRSAFAAGVSSLLTQSGPVAALDEAQLEARLLDAERAVNMLQAAQADLMNALHARAEEADATLPASVAYLASRREEGVVDQIALTLTCTRMAASYRYDTAREAAAFPAVMNSWHRGSIDVRKVAVICDQLARAQRDEAELDSADPDSADPTSHAVMSSETVDRLATTAAEHAESHTGSQTRAWLARHIIAIDPAAAETRHVRASAKRQVRLTPLADGMAEVAAYLPAVQARQAFDMLTTLAYQADGPDERRTLEQRRADVLMDLVTGREGPPETPEVMVNVTVDVDTLMGLADHPAELAGYGPITAQQARTFFARAEPIYQRLITDPATGTLVSIDPARYRPTAGLERLIRARDRTCRFPGCRRSAATNRSGTDLDHTIPWPRGSTTPDNLAVLCRHHHRVKHTHGWAAELNPDSSMTWTTPGQVTLMTTAWHYTDPPPSM